MDEFFKLYPEDVDEVIDLIEFTDDEGTHNLMLEMKAWRETYRRREAEKLRS